MVVVDIHLSTGKVKTVFLQDETCLTDTASHKDAHGTTVAIYAYLGDSHEGESETEWDGWVWDPTFSDNW